MPKTFAALIAVSGALVLGLVPQAAAITSAERDGNVIRVTSGGEDNNLAVRYILFAGEIGIEDPTGVAAGNQCSTSNSEVRCDLQDVELVEFELNAGNDSVAINFGSLAASLATLPLSFDGGSGNDGLMLVGAGSLSGGPGDDTLTGSGDLNYDNRLSGGGGEDRLVDNEGDDTLKGGGGRDKLKGGDDRDRYAGGGGKDRVRARDFTQDRRINCGAGDDKLRADPFDPRPRSC